TERRAHRARRADAAVGACGLDDADAAIAVVEVENRAFVIDIRRVREARRARRTVAHDRELHELGVRWWDGNRRSDTAPREADNPETEQYATHAPLQGRASRGPRAAREKSRRCAVDAPTWLAAQAGLVTPVALRRAFHRGRQHHRDADAE